MSTFVAVVLGILLALLAAEFAIRRWWPQSSGAVMINGRNLYRRDRTVGWVGGRDAHAVIKHPEYRIDYRFNSDGMRDRVDHAIAKPIGRTRIIAVGSSLTEGLGLEYEATWPVLLEKQLQGLGYDVDVIKAGVSGYSTHQALRRLEQLASVYRPDIAILSFYDPIILSAPSADEERRMLTRARSPHWFKSTNFHLATLVLRYALSWDRIYRLIYPLSAFAIACFVEPMTADIAQQIETTKRALAKALAYCRSNHIELIVASCPVDLQMVAKRRGIKLRGLNLNQIDDALAKFAEEQGLTWMRLTDDFLAADPSNRQRFHYRFDGHLNPDGSKVFADAVTQHLAAQLSQRKFAAEG